MPIPGPQNRRKYARLDIALTVSYAVEHSGGKLSEYAEATSSDISAGGLRLMTPTALTSGTKLDLEIYLGDDVEKKINAKGEVVWQNKISPTSFETGVLINQMDNDSKKRFMEFVFDQMSRVVGLGTVDRRP
ncbi:MAG: PilZ domain-containing protein [Deltaproteobacteria bacterium]|nr:PilZ domain-containing protein [Deltaproteobacteria bacterium]MBI4224048.1 PilZ domain-containing protein [Deltaproteobacteria bacterium]